MKQHPYILAYIFNVKVEWTKGLLVEGGGVRSSAVHRQIAPVFSHWITLHDVCAGRLATTRLMIYSLQCINNAHSFLKSYVNTLAGAARERCEFPSQFIVLLRNSQQLLDQFLRFFDTWNMDSNNYIQIYLKWDATRLIEPYISFPNGPHHPIKYPQLSFSGNWQIGK